MTVPEGAGEGPDAGPARLGGFRIVGLDYRTCPGPVRERLFVADEEVPAFLARLRAAGAAPPAMALSTCDRIEALAIPPGGADLEGAVAAALAEPNGLAARDVRALLHARSGTAALRHLFRVAAALDSQTVGEPQILGQVRASRKLAAGLGMVNPDLDRPVRAACAAAARARSETAIAEGPVSLAAAALWTARRVHGDLSRCRAAAIGAGEAGLALAADLRRAGVRDIEVCDRNPRRAAAAARELGGRAADFDARGATLARADIAIAANGDGTHAIGEATVRAALRARRNRPVFIVDLGVPPDVDPAVERLEGAFVYDLDDLERLALEGRSSRAAAVADAEAVVERELARFLGDLAARGAGPLVRDLRAAFEAERRALLDERPGLDAERATRLLVRRLLHRPSEAVRALAAEDGVDARTEALVRALLIPEDGGEGRDG